MLLGLLATLALAQQPSDTWRTLETEHFVLHYPAPAEAWAHAAGARLEAMRERVQDQVGMSLDVRSTYVVRDPYAAANGLAYPFLKRPRTELWLTPPGADSPIGWNRRWDEGLIVHEHTHLVHLAQPARGGPDRLLGAITGFGPIGRKAPRWVTEGYATLVEGDQTGFGRPFAAVDSAMVRQLATEGRLPTYDELDGSSAWRSGGFAYSIGNSYLRWLRAREGEDRLPEVWRRMTAVQNRSFEEAFEGVFGEAPEVLYGRFVAEATQEAMLLEEARPPRTDTRWIDGSRGSGAPAISPDGSRIAMVVSRGGRSVLSVWKAEPDKEQAQEDWDKRVGNLLQRDPQDVPARRSKEPDLGTPVTRSRRDRTPSGPRWQSDSTLVFSARAPDRAGRIRRDLYTWDVDSLVETRLTRGQDLHSPDPISGTQDLVAVQTRWGASCLARVDGQTGDATCLTEPSPHVIIDGPRVHPDGDRILWLEQNDGPWTLWTAPLSEEGLGDRKAVSVPSGANLSSPTWHPDGEQIVASFGLPHLLEIAAIHPGDGRVQLWTRSHGGARAPAVTAEHVYWLDLDADGADLHRSPHPSPEDTEPIPPLPEGDFSPALTPDAIEVPLPATGTFTTRRYGLGRTEARFLPSLQVTRNEVRALAGARLGDLVGRHQALLFGGIHRDGDGRTAGFRASTVFRVLPPELLVDAWITQEPGSKDLRVGAGVALQDRAQGAATSARYRVGAFVDPGLGDATPRHAGHIRLAAGLREPSAGLVSLSGGLGATAGSLGGEGLGAWVSGGARLGVWRNGLSGSVQLRQALGDASDLRLGGLVDPLLPGPWQADRIFEPALGRDVARGRTHLRLGAALGGDSAAAFFTRHSLGESLDTSRGTMLVGLRAGAPMPEQRMVKLPRGRLHVGVACRVEDPQSGIDDNACRSLDDYTAWLDFRWLVD